MAKIRPKERSAEEKTAIVLSLLRGDATAAELCRRHGVSEGTLGKWRERFLNAGEAALAGGRTKDIPTSLLEHENQALKDALAKSVLRHELFKNPSVAMSFTELEALRAEMGLGVNAFLRYSGVSKSSYYRRKRQGGKTQNPPPEFEAAVKRLCDEHPRLGYRPIHAKLQKTHAASASTVYRVVKRLNLCRQRKRRGAPVQSAPAPLILEQLGLTVGLDFTHWDRKPICNVLEYGSRYCLAAVVSERETSEAATAALDQALQEAKRLGMLCQGIEVKSDHGSTFTAAPFRAFLTKRRGQQTLSAVGRPQGMGRVERFNRSLKEQGLQPEEFDPGGSLQPLLDLYRDSYKRQRPHQALDCLTPLEFLHAQGCNSVPLN